MSEQPGAAGGRPQVRVTTSSGSITITAEARDDIAVESKGRVERRPSTSQDPIDVRRSDSVKLRCPTGSDVMAGTSSGSVRLLGVFGDVRVTSQSGSIDVGEVTSADLRTRSGNVDVVGCDGLCRVELKSGSVRVRRAGDADIGGGSGTARVSGLTARVRTVSGTIDLAVGSNASVETVSGSITVSLPAHVRPRVDVGATKRAHIDVVQGEDCDLSVRSLSGSVTVRAR